MYNYVHVPICEQAVLSEDVFNTFKTNQSFTTILEHTATHHAGTFLQRIIDEYPDKYKDIDWEVIKQNDSVGSPYMHEYEQMPDGYKLIAPSTIAYTFKALEILNHIKESGLNDVSILEIGGGYGGQCKILLDLSTLFDIRIKSYTIIDLHWPNKLQQKYLKTLGYKNKVKFISYESLMDGKTIPKFDYLISVYALGEFSSEIQQFYVDKMPELQYYYLVWNTSKVHDKFIESDIEEERPRTGPQNVVIKSRIAE